MVQLIADKKATLRADNRHSEKQGSNDQGRDLLTLLIQANMAADVSESQKMTDEEVLGRESSKLLLSSILRLIGLMLLLEIST